MKRCKLVALAIAVLMTMLIPATAFAATHEDVDTWDKLQAAFADTDADVTIILTGNITTLGALQTGKGQTYVINGEEYILKDVRLVGEGEVEINAEVQRDGQAQALRVTDDVQVTVNGDVKSEGSMGAGVIADGNSKTSINGTVDGGDIGVVSGDKASVEVKGDVSGTMVGTVSEGESSVQINGDVSANGAGVVAGESSQVEVTGNISGGQIGTSAEGSASVTVKGDVTGGSAAVVGSEQSKTEVTGNVAGGQVTEPEIDQVQGAGVYADGEATVNVTGNVTGGNVADSADGQSADLKGGTGVIAQENSNVKVDGNVTGGNGSAASLGDTVSDDDSYSDGGYGMIAGDQSKVEVTGNVTGGDSAGGNGYAGSGIEMSPKADVTVGGDVKGGNTDGATGIAGQGAIVYSLDKADPDNEDAEPGKLVVMGTVEGGSALLESGKDGNGVYFGDPYSEIPEEEWLTAEEVYITEIPAGTFADFMTGLMMGKMLPVLDGYGYTQQEMAEILADFMANKVFTKIADLLGHEYTGSAQDDEVLQNLSDEQMQTLKQSVADDYNALIKEKIMAVYDVELTLPEVTVWEVKGGDDAAMFGGVQGEFIASLLGLDTNYIVKIVESEGGMLVSDKETAKAGETVTVTALPKAGYTLGKVLLNGEELTGKDGVYSFVMPEGGGVELSAEFIADAPAEAPTNTAGSPKTGDNFSAALLLGLMAVSAMAVVVVGRKARTGK